MNVLKGLKTGGKDMEQIIKKISPIMKIENKKLKEENKRFEAIIEHCIIGKTVYVNRPQNSAKAEECIIQKSESGTYLVARSPKDKWAHYMTARDIGNNVFFTKEEAESRL